MNFFQAKARTLLCSLFFSALAACGGGGGGDYLGTPPGVAANGAVDYQNTAAGAASGAGAATAPQGTMQAPATFDGPTVACTGPECQGAPDGLADQYRADAATSPAPASMQGGYPQVASGAVIMAEPFVAISVGTASQTRVF